MAIKVSSFQDMAFDDFMRTATPSRVAVVPKKGEMYRCSRCSMVYLVEKSSGRKHTELYCLTNSRRSNTAATSSRAKNGSHDFIKVEEEELSNSELEALRAYRRRN